MLKRLIGSNITIHWRPSPEPLPTQLDPIQLDQVLMNLLLNARDALDGKGTITLATAARRIDADSPVENLTPPLPPGEYSAFTVSDTGCGMSDDVREMIFEPFFTTKEAGAGSGLGLSTVFGILSQNNGGISVLSSPEKGAAFTCYLPKRIDDTTITGGRQPLPDRNVNPASKARLLLVEDESEILKLCTLILQDLGHEVFAAGSASEAMEVFESSEEAFDLLISDVIMPDCNGFELFDQLNAMHPLRCIFISGYTADLLHRKQTLPKNCLFLLKPFTAGQLEEAVQKQLQNRPVPT